MSFAPVLAFAAPTDTVFANIESIIDAIGRIVKSLIPITFGLALVYFFYGVAKYILSATNQKAADEGKAIMIYGVIAIAVMASLYGLVGFLQGTFGVGSGSAIIPPSITGL